MGPLKIIRLEAENVKKLRAVSITPDGNVVQITGANGAGKSSVLDCIWMALAGKSAAPAQPVRAGEEEARIRLDLGEIIVSRKFTADGGTSLSVTTAEGAKFPSPQTMLDKLLGALTFDPLGFTRMKPKEQRTELARLLGITDQLAQMERERADVFAARTDINRDLKRAEAQLAGMPAVEPCEPVDVSAVVAEIRAAREHNAAVTSESGTRERRRVKMGEHRARALELRDKAAQIIAQAEALEADADAIDNWLSEAEPLSTLIDLAPVEEQLTNAEHVNAQHRAYADRVNAQALVSKLREESDHATKAIEELDTAARALVAGAKLPVDGLGVTDDGVTYNGLPLEQASSAEQLRVSVAIAMAMHPTLRVLRIQDGALLDERSLGLIAEMADANDYQCWIERVGTDAKVGILMEDGTARVVGEPASAEPEPSRRRRPAAVA